MRWCPVGGETIARSLRLRRPCRRWFPVLTAPPKIPYFIGRTLQPRPQQQWGRAGQRSVRDRVALVGAVLLTAEGVVLVSHLIDEASAALVCRSLIVGSRPVLPAPGLSVPVSRRGWWPPQPADGSAADQRADHGDNGEPDGDPPPTEALFDCSVVPVASDSEVSGPGRRARVVQSGVRGTGPAPRVSVLCRCCRLSSSSLRRPRHGRRNRGAKLMLLRLTQTMFGLSAGLEVVDSWWSRPPNASRWAKGSCSGSPTPHGTDTLRMTLNTPATALRR